MPSGLLVHALVVETMEIGEGGVFPDKTRVHGLNFGGFARLNPSALSLTDCLTFAMGVMECCEIDSSEIGEKTTDNISLLFNSVTGAFVAHNECFDILCGKRRICVSCVTM